MSCSACSPAHPPAGLSQAPPSSPLKCALPSSPCVPVLCGPPHWLRPAPCLGWSSLLPCSPPALASALAFSGASTPITTSCSEPTWPSLCGPPCHEQRVRIVNELVNMRPTDWPRALQHPSLNAPVGEPVDSAILAVLKLSVAAAHWLAGGPPGSSDPHALCNPSSVLDLYSRYEWHSLPTFSFTYTNFVFLLLFKLEGETRTFKSLL